MDTTPHPWQDPKTKEIVVDYCIIGGGISGLYSAVRLSQVPRGEDPPRICILEATDRIGGRVATIKIPGTSFSADLGAMRFIPSQPLLGSLVEHYGLETYDYDFPTDFYFVRGRRIGPQPAHGDPVPAGAEQLVEIPTTPAPAPQKLYHSLRSKEIDKEPGALVIHAIAAALQEVRLPEPGRVDPANTARLVDVKDVNLKLRNCYPDVLAHGFKAFTPIEWRTIKLLGKYPTVDGLYLYQLGFWDVVQSQLSSEAYSFVDEGLGYQTIIGTWNAADAIPWFLTDFFGTYRSVAGGMGQIPRRLHISFLEAMAQRRELNPFKPARVVFQRTRVKKVCWRESDNKVAIEANVDVEDGITASCRVAAAHCLVCISKGALEKIKFGVLASDDQEESDLRERSVLVEPLPSETGQKSRVESAPRRTLIGNVVNRYTPDQKFYTFDWLLGCVEPQPLLKMFFAFQRAWWEEAWQRATEQRPQVPQGFKVFTNLPLRQIFYHFPNSRSRTANTVDMGGAGEPEGMVMAYCDSKHASYWEALRGHDGRRYASKEVTAVLRRRENIESMRREGSDLDLNADLEEFGVSRHLAERAHEQIWRVHRGLAKCTGLPAELKEVSDFARDDDGKQEEIPRSETVLFMNWMRPPFYGGWHAWRIGIVSDDAKMMWERPWTDTRIYFAGEMISSDQGWSEGALRSAERVLMHQLGQPAPTWQDISGMGGDVVEKARALGYDSIEEYINW